MKNLIGTLKKINALGITTRESLSLNISLYEELFLNVDRFITGTVFRSCTNIDHLLALHNLGVDIEDVHMDCLEHCIIKLDYVLGNDLGQQIPCFYTICNNVIVSSHRNASKETNAIISLNEIISSLNADDNSKRTKAFDS